MRRATVYSELAEQLSEVARHHGLIHKWHKPPFLIERTRVGRHQKAAGAYLFFLRDIEWHEIFASCDRATKVLKAHKEKRLSHLVEYGTNTLIVERKPTEEYLKENKNENQIT